MRDDAPGYQTLGPEFAAHGTTMHSHHEYVRGIVHSNSAESFLALLKRGIHGTLHSVSRKHLHKYLAEHEFRYNVRRVDDGDRTLLAIRRAEGKRLMYREQTASNG